MKRRTFPCLTPRQAHGAQVACFVATPPQIAEIARIDRINRDVEGDLRGFQRTQIAPHIREIGDYLARDDAMLANSIVLGFVGNASIKRRKDGSSVFTVEWDDVVPGLIVDGQQRYSALTEGGLDNFEVPLTAFICDTEEELRRQFILINSTKPLSKSHIYELLPQVTGLPRRYSARTDAQILSDRLNFKKGSALFGSIRQETNPRGFIKSTSLQRMLMSSLSDGALRLYRGDEMLLKNKGTDLVSEYFHAVKHVFADAWDGHTPATSRLVHGAGIASMGYVFEYLHAALGAMQREDFLEPLVELRPYCAWTDGEWRFGNEVRRWNSPQDVSADIRMLSYYLVQQTKKNLEGRKGQRRVRR